MGTVPKIGRGDTLEALKNLPPEDAKMRGARLRDKRTRNTSGLLRGDSGIREHRATKAKRAQERLEARRAQVDAMVGERAASLPPEMSKSPIVMDSIRNLSRIQVILDGFLDQIDADVDNEHSESIIKATTDLFAKVKSSHDDLLAKWPRQEDTRPVQQIPASVMAWIEAESAKPVEVVNG